MLRFIIPLVCPPSLDNHCLLYSLRTQDSLQVAGVPEHLLVLSIKSKHIVRMAAKLLDTVTLSGQSHKSFGCTPRIVYM